MSYPIPDVDALIDGMYVHLMSRLPTGLIKTPKPTNIAAGRRVLDWKEVTEMPALFCRHPYDDDLWRGESLPIVAITAHLIGYVQTKYTNGVPDRGLSNLVSAVRTALEPDDNDPQGLKLEEDSIPLVYRCRIEGRTRYDPGDSDKIGKFIMPVVLTYPI